MKRIKNDNIQDINFFLNVHSILTIHCYGNITPHQSYMSINKKAPVRRLFDQRRFYLKA